MVRWSLIGVAIFLCYMRTFEALADSFNRSEVAIGEEVPELPAEADKMLVDIDDQPDSDEASQQLNRESESTHSAEVAWRFSGGVGATSDFVSGHATVGYYWVRYVGIETTYFYYQLNSERMFGVQQGPEIDLVARIFNSTMVTPFAGFGPGFTRWHRRYQGQTFSEGGSLTGNVLFGVDIALTRHFGMQVQRKNMNYLGATPVEYTSRVDGEARSTWFTNIGFRTAF